MSASAPRGRSISRPAARNLSLSLVEHPHFCFRTYGAYGPSTSATPITSALNDTKLADSGNMRAIPSAHALASGCKRGADFTPFTAMTVDSVYSQDSWTEQEDECPNSAQAVVHYRVDTRRFAVALSPGIDFNFPSESPSFPSAATGMFGVASEAESSLTPSRAAELRPAPEMLPRSMMATEVPVIPDASKPTPAETRAPLAGRRTIKRSPSIAKKLGRILSRVNIVSLSGNKHPAALQVTLPDHQREIRDKRPVSQPSPPDSPADSDFVLDIRNDGGSIASTDASDGIRTPKQLEVLQLDGSAQTFQARTTSLVYFHDRLFLPAIVVSPLAVTFDKATTNWDSQVDLYSHDLDMELIGIAI